MKRFFSSFLIAVLLVACQRDRLTAPTFLIQVTPSAAAVPQGTNKVFTATFQGTSGTIEGLPTWSVQPANLGTISPATGLQVTFATGATLASGGTLQATFGGVTGSAQIFVRGSVPPPGSLTYGIFVETLPPPGIKFDVPNPPDPDGGLLGPFNGGGGTITLSNGTNPGEFTEGTLSLKAVYSDGGTPGTAFAGWFIQFGDPNIVPHNFTAFAGGSFKFDVRMTQDVQAKIDWGPGAAAAGSKFFSMVNDLGIPPDNAFHSVVIPLSSFTGIDLANVRTIAFSAVTIPSETYYIDNARFEK